MKLHSLLKLLTLLALPLLGVQAQAQSVFNQEPVLVHPNEVKVDLLNSVLLLRPTIQYERLLRPDLGVGGTISVTTGDNNELFPKFSATAFTRWYFQGSALSQQKVGSGFFIGVVAGYNHYIVDKVDNENTQSHRSRINSAHLGIGVDLGWKYLSVSNWIGEIGGTVGRNIIGTSNNSFQPPVFGQYYITIGRRF